MASYVLIIACVILLCVLAEKFSDKFGMPALILFMFVLVNKNWTQILNFFTAKIGFLCNVMDVLIHPCLVGWSVSGME